MLTLILFEKPSQEKIFKTLLSDVKKASSSNGRGSIGELSGETIITFPLSGKITEIDDSEKNEDWSDFSLLPKIPKKDAFFKRVVSEQGEDIFKALKAITGKYKIDNILLATDPDYEGMGLGVEALEVVGLDTLPIVSMNISNVTPDVLRKEALKALAGESSHDWKTMALIAKIRGDLNKSFGVSASRVLTTECSDFISVGLQQTRLLAEIVQRTIENREHKSVEHFKIKINTEIGVFYLALPTDKKDNEDILTDKSFFEEILKEMGSPSSLKISSIQNKEALNKSRKWFDGSSMAGEVSIPLKINLKNLISKGSGLLQRMYEDGIMTYPRGDSAGVMPLSQLKEQQLIAETISSYYSAPRLDTGIVKKYLWFKDGEIEQNHTPFTIANPKIEYMKLGKAEKVVFDTSAKMLLSCFYPDNKTATKTIISTINGHRFLTKEVSDVDLGWREIYGEKERKSSLGNIKEGDVININSIEIESIFPKPKPLFTEKSLLAVMKKKSIGTEATYSSTIELMFEKKRTYASITRGKISSTKKGEMLISLVPAEILSYLELFEKEIIKKLESGEMNKATALLNRNDLINDAFNLILGAVKTEVDIVEYFRKNSTQKTPSIKIKGACPICKKGVLYNEKSAILSCENKKSEKVGDKYIAVEGSCSFSVFGKTAKTNKKLSYQVTKEQFEELLETGKTETVFYWIEKKKVFNQEIMLDESKGYRIEKVEKTKKEEE